MKNEFTRNVVLFDDEDKKNQVRDENEEKTNECMFIPLYQELRQVVQREFRQS